jgi:hypothetical protein
MISGFVQMSVRQTAHPSYRLAEGTTRTERIIVVVRPRRAASRARRQ